MALATVFIIAPIFLGIINVEIKQSSNGNEDSITTPVWLNAMQVQLYYKYNWVSCNYPAAGQESEFSRCESNELYSIRLFWLGGEKLLGPMVKVPSPSVADIVARHYNVRMVVGENEGICYTDGIRRFPSKLQTLVLPTRFNEKINVFVGEYQYLPNDYKRLIGVVGNVKTYNAQETLFKFKYDFKKLKSMPYGKAIKKAKLLKQATETKRRAKRSVVYCPVLTANLGVVGVGGARCDFGSVENGLKVQINANYKKCTDEINKKYDNLDKGLDKLHKEISEKEKLVTDYFNHQNKLNDALEAWKKAIKGESLKTNKWIAEVTEAVNNKLSYSEYFPWTYSIIEDNEMQTFIETVDILSMIHRNSCSIPIDSDSYSIGMHVKEVIKDTHIQSVKIQSLWMGLNSVVAEKKKTDLALKAVMEQSITIENGTIRGLCNSSTIARQSFVTEAQMAKNDSLLIAHAIGTRTISRTKGILYIIVYSICLAILIGGFFRGTKPQYYLGLSWGIYLIFGLGTEIYHIVHGWVGALL